MRSSSTEATTLSAGSAMLSKGKWYFVAFLIAILGLPCAQPDGWARAARAPKALPGAASMAATIPSGTVLYVRLQTPVSTKTCKKGQAVMGSVAREVTTQGGAAVPLGATLKGSIEKCVQPSSAEDRSELLLKFTEVAIPGQGSVKLTGHVSGVTNARETVQEDGTIMGMLKTEAPVSLLGGVLQKIGAANPSIGKEIQKQKIGEVNTAIDYPVGTDLQFTLTQPLAVERLSSATGPSQLPSDMSTGLTNFLADAPQRSVSKDNKPGDPINLVFVGTAPQIEQAFRKAGWLEPKTRNGVSILDTARAVANNEGFGAAPISDLYLYGHKEDMAFEKMLNTFNKRHHLRLWQAPARAPDGRPVWLGAATHDTGIDVHPGVVSHATDPNLDDEREQVASDLLASGAAQAVELIARANPLTSGFTATGGAWHTDGRLLAVDVKPGQAAAK